MRQVAQKSGCIEAGKKKRKKGKEEKEEEERGNMGEYVYIRHGEK